MTDVRAVQAEGAGTLVEASVTLDLVCAATRDAYERVWRLLAYYSDVSAAMAADPETEIGDGDDITARYAQDPDDDDTLYYTGLRVNLTTPPSGRGSARPASSACAWTESARHPSESC